MAIPKSDFLFQQWKASLPSRDRSKDAAQLNFEELFANLKAEGLSNEEVYTTFLPRAVKAHYPVASHVKNAWKKWKHLGKWNSEKEMEEQWQQETANSAEAAFFEVFPVETLAPPKEVEVPKVYGNMSEKEYKMLREYAEAIPSFDFESLDKERAQATDVDVDLEDFLRTAQIESK